MKPIKKNENRDQSTVETHRGILPAALVGASSWVRQRTIFTEHTVQGSPHRAAFH